MKMKWIVNDDDNDEDDNDDDNDEDDKDDDNGQ